LVFFRFLIFDGGWAYHRFFLFDNTKWSLRRRKKNKERSRARSRSRRTRVDYQINILFAKAGAGAGAHLIGKIKFFSCLTIKFYK
jgi:hypothetical protein